ncbi:hypothetical protein SEA_SCHMIDT_65 [Gordonia phage Schmidt]|uniref:Uncharacterized protein n=1 Tax=Gordonia phage Schmidt TaxID=2301697 RepID=A0A385E2T5_9CAUD|nr:hypothetical protein KDJ59_gp65 [Gordonia phage Schmidt]AXQ65185.1 hypothetical protein SEA_SCHMIDT_65 [Gordonia phage Schmidt]
MLGNPKTRKAFDKVLDQLADTALAVLELIESTFSPHDPNVQYVHVVVNLETGDVEGVFADPVEAANFRDDLAGLTAGAELADWSVQTEPVIAKGEQRWL